MQINDLFQNVGFVFGLTLTIFIILMAVFIKMNVRIFHPGVHYKLYRKGRLLKEGHGGMVVRIPFLDRLEVVGVNPRYAHDFTLSPKEKSIRKDVIIDAAIEDVWKAWSTYEGVTSFFAPSAKIGLYIGGPYEMYFDPEAPYGSRGGEGLRILSYLPPDMISFEWNAPPSFPIERKAKTWVVVQLKELSDGQTKVVLTHFGWQEGLRWEEVYDYFVRAWDIVLDRLERRFSEGPIDWNSLQARESGS